MQLAWGINVMALRTKIQEKQIATALKRAFQSAQRKSNELNRDTDDEPANYGDGTEDVIRQR